MGEPERNEGEFPLIAFAIDTVAGLTGLSVGQLQRWDRNGFVHPSLADPNRRRPYSRIYSFNDVVALRTIAMLRQAGVSFARLKEVLGFLTPTEKGEWPARCFHVVGNRVFLTRDDAMAAARDSGPQNEPTTLDIESVITEVEEAAQRLRKRTPEQIGQVTRHRGIMEGAPIIAGTRIPTATIAWFHSHDYSVGEILEEFPRLTPEDIRAAVDFERSREVERLAPVLARG